MNLPDEFPDDTYAVLGRQMTERRRAQMERVVKDRTNHIRLVLQDVHDPHNISACLRSADAFGVQNVDVVTLGKRYKPSTAARGVEGWLTVRRHSTIADCVHDLRENGYRILTGVPRSDAVALEDVPLEQKIAVVFGNEHAGVDSGWLEHIDTAFVIPMVGMVESLNISVSAAITLQHLTGRARKIVPNYPVTGSEQRALLNRWAAYQTPSWRDQLVRLRNS